MRKMTLAHLWMLLSFCVGAILCAALPRIASAAPPPAAPAPGITGVFVDIAHIHHDTASNGDTWDYAWAEDDNLYTFADDGRGYAQGKGDRNLNFNMLTGDAWDGLTGSSVNMMDEYGKAIQAFANGANWKTTGCDCIDGVLYAFVANNWYGDKPAYGLGAVDPYLRQTALNLSLIKSTDHGKTWTRTEAQNYDHPMWTSFKFSTAYFFKYGRNGGSTTQDSQNRYVYAISNNGYWNDGTNFYLGRVPRAKIGRLNPADWQFYADGGWTADVNSATPIPGFPNGQVKCASGSPLWLAGLHKYVTVTWYNPEPADTRLKWDYPQDRIFEFYQADHPWGPWSAVGQIKASDFIADRKEAKSRWYGPSLSPKFITRNPDGSVTALMTFAGMTWEDAPGSLYSNNCVPVTFSTAPQPRLLQWINDSNPAVAYSDGWDYQQNRGVGDYYDDLHVSSTPGATIEFSFQGSGLEILSEKHADLGAMEVIIDGVSRGTVSQTQNPFPLLYRVPVYRNMTLPYGEHTVRLVNKAPAGTKVTFDGYRVYGDGPLPTVPPPAVSVPRGEKYEAESGVYGSAEAFSDSAASGGAAARKLDTVPGSGVKFGLVAAGTHLSIRYCTEYDPGRLSLYVNGVKVQDVTLPKTGGWDGNYKFVTVLASIPAGAEIKLQCDAGDAAANVDYIIVSQ